MTIHSYPYPQCLLPREYHPFFLEEGDKFLISRVFEAARDVQKDLSTDQKFSHTNTYKDPNPLYQDVIEIVWEKMPKKEHVSFLNISGEMKWRDKAGKYFTSFREEPHFVVKSTREDIPTTKMANIGRVLLAEKINRYLKQNGYEEEFEVVQERLYFHDLEQKFYVVGRALDLTLQIPSFGPLYKKQIRQSASPSSFEGKSRESESDTDEETSSEASGSSKHLSGSLEEEKKLSFLELKFTQAKALAELAVNCGYTDLGIDNLHYTKNGKVAIVDTEPFKEVVNERFFNKWIRDRDSLLAQQAIGGIAKLKLYCSNMDAFKAVEKVEAKHALWTIAKTVMKIALAALTFYFIPSLSLPFLGSAAASVKLVLLELISLKISELVFSTVFTGIVWYKSCQIRGIEGSECQDEKAIDSLENWQKRGWF